MKKDLFYGLLLFLFISGCSDGKSTVDSDSISSDDEDVLIGRF
jgi:hypothetical protein